MCGGVCHICVSTCLECRSVCVCGMAVTSQRCIVVEWAFVVCRVLGEYECFGYLGCLLFVMSPSCAPLFLFFIPIKSSEPPTLRSFSTRYQARRSDRNIMYRFFVFSPRSPIFVEPRCTFLYHISSNLFL